MDKNKMKDLLKTAAQHNSLLTPKHDPRNLSTTYKSDRTVLSHELAPVVNDFIESGEYILTEYHNNLHPNSPLYLELEPYPDSHFSVPASGVIANSNVPSTALDRIIAVSGTVQSWHVFGEDSNEIKSKVSNGELTLKNKEL
jgi:hypothetical protein